MLLDISRIGQIALPVADVDGAEDFYRTMLGLRHLYRLQLGGAVPVLVGGQRWSRLDRT